METLNNLPKWFWFSLAAIVVITIGATMYCNKRSKENASNVASTLNTNTNTVNDQESIFDSISTIQNMSSDQT